MTYPGSHASSGNTGHISDHNNMADDIQRLEGRTTSGLSYSTIVPLDSFSGASDDLKLAAAMSYAGAQTYPPYIGLGARNHTFNSALGQPYDGFGLIGGNRGWANSAGKYPTRATINITGPWISLSGICWNYMIDGIYFLSTNGNTQFYATGSNVAWANTIRNVGFKGFKGVLGNSTTGWLQDLCTFNGQWETLTCYDTPFNIKGGDARELWSEGMNIGSGDDPSGGGNKYLMIFGGNSKATVGPIYLTADNGWRGIQFNGSQSSGYGITLRGAVIEGRNPGDPCIGNLVRVTGGAVTMRDCIVDCGMTSPLGTEHGLIEVTGTDSQLVVDGLTVNHATGVATTMPVVYIAGTAGSVYARVQNVMRSTRSGSPAWGTQLPVIRQSVSGLLLDADTSTQLLTGP